MNGIDKYLIDTNILIYYFNGLIKDKKIHKIFKESFNVSIITKIEFLSWKKLLDNDILKQKAYDFISQSYIYTLDEKIANETINLRQNYSIKTPDAIIAATARINNLTLITNNIKDFEKIDIKIENIY